MSLQMFLSKIHGIIH